LQRLLENTHEGGIEQALALSRQEIVSAAFELAEQGQKLRLSRPIEAAGIFTRAIAAFESLPTEFQDRLEQALAGCFHELGSALAIAGRFEDAVPAYQRSVSGFERLARRDPAQFEPMLASALSGLAATLRELARWSESIGVSQRAAELYDRLRLASTSSAFDLKLGRACCPIRSSCPATPGPRRPRRQ
jgi:tetratricopeptide (TPR) repeat protein